MPDQDAVIAFIANLPGVDHLATPHAHFFYYDPQRDRPVDRTQPFATVVDADDFDGGASDLARPGVFRVNVGVGRETYRALFGPEPPWDPEGKPLKGHDFTALDAFLPHPVYAALSWVCVLNPERTWPQAQAYLREAHALDVERHRRRHRV